jgi:hypothetical protein
MELSRFSSLLLSAGITPLIGAVNPSTTANHWQFTKTG